MRVVFRGNVCEAELTELATRCGLDFVVVHAEDVMLRALSSADALWIASPLYCAAIPEAVKATRGKLQWIGLTSAGYDVLQQAGVPPGVQVTYAHGFNAPLVAEHAVALLLALVRQLPRAVAAQARGDWDTSVMHDLRSLEDLTVGIVGFGAIGGAIATRLRPLCERVIGVSRSGKLDTRADLMFPHARLHEALALSDAIIVAVTSNEETRHLIDENALRALPAHALVVNVCRGAVLDSLALCRALSENRLAGAALDVTEPEPLPSNDPLWRVPGVIITPHIAGWSSRATGRRLADHFERNVNHFTRGEPLEDTVSLPAL